MPGFDGTGPAGMGQGTGGGRGYCYPDGNYQEIEMPYGNYQNVPYTAEGYPMIYGRGRAFRGGRGCRGGMVLRRGR
jgi:hypothetical protein